MTLYSDSNCDCIDNDKIMTIIIIIVIIVIIMIIVIAVLLCTAQIT